MTNSACLCFERQFNYNKPSAFIFDKDLFSKVFGVRSNISTLPTEESLEAKLYDEIKLVYKDCKDYNWDDEDAEGISLDSVVHAMEFTKYLYQIKTPAVVPYANGIIGFEWNMKNEIIISVAFKVNNIFIFSIIAPGISEYGTNIQNINNQKDFVERISRILNNA